PRLYAMEGRGPFARRRSPVPEARIEEWPRTPTRRRSHVRLLHRSGPGQPITPRRTCGAGASQADKLARSPAADGDHVQTDRDATAEVAPTGPKKWHPPRPLPTGTC